MPRKLDEKFLKREKWENFPKKSIKKKGKLYDGTGRLEMVYLIF